MIMHSTSYIIIRLEYLVQQMFTGWYTKVIIQERQHSCTMYTVQCCGSGSGSSVIN
jgi:hypothetical protein